MTDLDPNYLPPLPDPEEIGCPHHLPEDQCAFDPKGEGSFKCRTCGRLWTPGDKGHGALKRWHEAKTRPSLKDGDPVPPAFQSAAPPPAKRNGVLRYSARVDVEDHANLSWEALADFFAKVEIVITGSIPDIPEGLEVVRLRRIKADRRISSASERTTETRGWRDG